MQNYVAHIWGHHWSLAIEEHFYLLIALVFPLLVRYTRFAPLVFITCVLIRIITVILYPGHWIAETHLRLDSLFMGVGVGYVYHFGDLKEFYDRHQSLLIAVSLFPLMFLFSAKDPIESPWTQTIGYSALYFSFASLLIVFLYANVQWLIWKPIAKLGFYSYGVYLFHLYFIRFVVGETYFYDQPHEFTTWTIPSFLLFLMGGLVFGIGMSYLVEKPFLQIRGKFFPQRKDINIDAVPGTSTQKLGSANIREISL